MVPQERYGELSLGIDGEPKVAVTPPANTTPAKSGDGDVGAALRSVYQKTVEEQIPDEFLDLLGRLG